MTQNEDGRDHFDGRDDLPAVPSRRVTKGCTREFLASLPLADQGLRHDLASMLTETTDEVPDAWQA